jgi:hypothetical protein
MRRLGVVVGLVLLVAVVSFLLFADFGAPAHVTAPVDTKSEVPARSPQIETAATRPEAAAIAPSSFTDPSSPPSVSEELVRVLVVEDTTGNPVPGATVVATDGEADSRDPRWRFSFVPLLAWWDSAPQRAVADHRGLAVIRTHERLVVAARHEDLFGFRRFPEAPHGEIRLAVKAGYLIAAKVVTAWGAPAPGIPLVTKLSHTKPTPGSTQLYVTSRSPDGLAIMSWGSSDVVGPERHDTFSAWIEGIETQAVQTPVGELRKGPLTITLPTAGQLRVELLAPDGRPLAADARVYVGVSSGLPPEKRPWVIPSPAVHADAVGGVASVPFVPVGVYLTVVGESDDFDLATLDIPPIESAAAVRSVVLQFSREKPVLAGRLVDEGGSPIVNRGFRFQVTTALPLQTGSVPPPRTQPRSLPSRESRTDAHGRFSLRSPDSRHIREGGLDLDFEIEDQAEVVSLAGFVSVPAIAAAGETQLGDVRLAPPATLAAGTVVDELGAPLAGAVVTARPVRMVPRLDAPVGIPRFRPLNQTPIRTRSDASGAFTLSLPPEARASPVRIGAFTIQATLEGYAQQDQAVSYEPGRRDLKIVLRGLGAIEGHLLLPANGVPVRTLRMVVTPTSATPSEPLRFEDCVDSDGHFRLAGIPPGLVTLVIAKAGAETPLASIADIPVPRLAASPDSRLWSIALD